MAKGRQNHASTNDRVKTFLAWGVYSLLLYQLGMLNSCGRRLGTGYWGTESDDVRDAHELPKSLPPISSSSSSTSAIDFLSISSREREDLLIAQQQSFGSHGSVRYWFNATEADDGDPHCSTELKTSELFQIVDFCRRQKLDARKYPFRMFMRNHYASKPWLRKKKNPVGWMCAQRRPIHGLYKVLKSYETRKIDLPEKLLVVDDDTYINVDLLQIHCAGDSVNSPLVRPGCLVRLPIHQLNFTFAFGGNFLLVKC